MTKAVLTGTLAFQRLWGQEKALLYGRHQTQERVRRAGRPVRDDGAWQHGEAQETQAQAGMLPCTAGPLSEGT